MEKKRVAIFCGGKSAEHEVSLQSTKCLYEAIDRDKFDPTLIGIDKQGVWHLLDSDKFIAEFKNPNAIINSSKAAKVCLHNSSGETQLISSEDAEVLKTFDLAFPMLHGPYGEDGSIQGLLKLLDLPFVGAGILGSAVSMDKTIAKRLMRDAGVPTSKFIVLYNDDPNISEKEVSSKLGFPCFIKPANMGSSIGITKVKDVEKLNEAISLAFKYDNKIILEEAITGAEVECAVLGNRNPEASDLVELVTSNKYEFHTYDSKYELEDIVEHIIPARFPDDVRDKFRKMVLAAYKVLNCEGMARVDGFITKDGKPYLNEINTIPGFRNISSYVELCAERGIPYTELITKLLELALERYDREAKLSSSYTD